MTISPPRHATDSRPRPAGKPADRLDHRRPLDPDDVVDGATELGATGLGTTGLSATGLGVAGLSATGLGVAGLGVAGLSVGGLGVAGLGATELGVAGLGDAELGVAGERHVMAAAESPDGSVVASPRSRRTVGSRRGARRAPGRHEYLGVAATRCALYLGPLSVAVAAVHPLREVAWQVPALVLLLGWTAAQALTSLGAATARRGGRPAAARLVGGGFLAVAGAWCGYVWVAPTWLLGPDRGLALSVGLGGLAVLATVTTALVTRAEAAVIRWSLPCWLLAAVNVAALLGDSWAAQAPVRMLLPAAITVAVVRAYRPVIGRTLPKRPPLDRADRWRGFGYAAIGAAQAIAAVLLWRAVPPGAAPLAGLPLLAAVPVLETLVCWHTWAVRRGSNGAEPTRDLRRHVRAVTWAPVVGLVPPLAAGGGLAFAAARLPYGPTGRDVVLALAAGALLGGVIAGTFLLAAQGRTALAAVVAALPLVPLPAVAPANRLPALVATLAVTHLVGLLAVALPADTRRSP